MGNIIYFLVAVLLIIWAIGYFGYSAGGFIHLLIVVALMAITIKIIAGAKSAK
jgi:hypothetical protein